MTIQTEGTTVYLRCTSGEEDVIIIDTTDAGNVHFSLAPDPDGLFGDIPQGDESLPLIVIPAAEALAIGQILIAMATRQLIRIPGQAPDEVT